MSTSSEVLDTSYEVFSTSYEVFSAYSGTQHQLRGIQHQLRGTHVQADRKSSASQSITVPLECRWVVPGDGNWNYLVNMYCCCYQKGVLVLDNLLFYTGIQLKQKIDLSLFFSYTNSVKAKFSSGVRS
jgi:hypothetical protein